MGAFCIRSFVTSAFRRLVGLPLNNLDQTVIYRVKVTSAFRRLVGLPPT